MQTQLQVREPGDAPEGMAVVLRQGGRALDPAARAFFEPRFGADLSTVRVHTGSQAAASARALNARAYTVGRDMVFDTGQYAPHSHGGRRLLAHELTHVLQQRLGRAAFAAVAGLAPGPVLSPAPQAIYRDTPAAAGGGGQAPARRIVYIDSSVIIEIERGNAEAARTLKDLLQTADVRMPNYVRRQLIDDSNWPEQQTARRLLLEDLRMLVMPDLPQDRIDQIAERNRLPPRGGNKRHIIDPRDVELVASTTTTTGGKLWTLDKRLSNNRKAASSGLGIEFAEKECEIKTVLTEPTAKHPKGQSPLNDYATGRTLLGLDPVVIAPDGKILRRGRQGRVLAAGSATPVDYPSGRVVAGEIHVRDPSPPASGGPARGALVPPGGGRTVAQVPPGVTARDLVAEIRQIEAGNRRMVSFANGIRYVLGAAAFGDALVQIAGSLGMAASTLAGGSPYRQEVQRAEAIALRAKELADYYFALDLRKSQPPQGWGAWQGWHGLQQVLFTYYELESQFRVALQSVAAAQKELRGQIKGLGDAMAGKTAALVYTPTSLAHADAYFFAEAAGRIRRQLEDASRSYRRAERDIYASQKMAQACIKFIEIRLRELGVHGLVFIDIPTKDLPRAELHHFTLKR